MSALQIRRHFKNYSLPSASKEILQSLCGRDVVGLKIGLRGKYAKAVADGQQVPEGALSGEGYREAGFLDVGNGKTIAFRFDELPSCIVMRTVDADLNDKHFLDKLYVEDDYVPWFLKTYLFAEMPGSQALIGKRIVSVSAYKYPDNFRGHTPGNDQLHEVAIGLKLSDGNEYLITPGLGKKRPSDLISVQPVSVLSDGKTEAPERIWESRGAAVNA